MADGTQIRITAVDATSAAFRSVQSNISGLQGALRGIAAPLAAAFSVAGIVSFMKSTIDLADRLNDDRSNRIQVISDMNLVARRFVSQIYINQGNLFDYMNIILPTESIPFMERFNFEVAGVVLNLQIEVFEDMNACEFYPTPTPTASVTPTATITPTPTLTPSATCPITTQYLEVQLLSCNAFKLAVWNDAGFTSNADALCDYVISGTAYGDLGTVYSGAETILSGQHQHNFNLNPVLQPGECISSFVVHSYSTPSCVCPVNLILP